MGKLGLELAMLSVDELRKRACDSGINELVVNATEKAGKNALIALIVGQQGVAGAVQKAGGMPTAEGITSKSKLRAEELSKHRCKVTAGEVTMDLRFDSDAQMQRWVHAIEKVSSRVG